MTLESEFCSHADSFHGVFLRRQGEIWGVMEGVNILTVKGCIFDTLQKPLHRVLFIF